MTPHAPRKDLPTHEVTNQPPPLGDRNLFFGDRALHDAVMANGGAPQAQHLATFGALSGQEKMFELGRIANENPPKLKTFDRYGHRIDEVEFHPAYHELMALGLNHGISARPWRGEPAGHVAHIAMMMMQSQADAGTGCPFSMTYAAVPALRKSDSLSVVWEPRVTAGAYDPAVRPAAEKSGVTLGMAMTEKQGGSDVRANTTRAVPDGEGFRLTGHKWFCSAPMCDAFLTLAQEDAGLSCFLVPRWTPDGARNAMHIMRLKDKLGDRSNASSEIEYHGAWAERVGEPGRGIRTIIEMVQHTRLDCVAGSASGMRAALAQALWHARHRRAFQKSLIDQPTMQALLSELAVEGEAATALALRLAGKFDLAHAGDADAGALIRLATPIAKYWICKRQPGFVYEALEAHGGAGFVEEGPMPRLFRQSPLNAIWEGSGNVIALDILRATRREPESVAALETHLSSIQGMDGAVDSQLADTLERMHSGCDEFGARALAEDLAVALQLEALKASAPTCTVEAFVALHFGNSRHAGHYGATVISAPRHDILDRASGIA